VSAKFKRSYSRTSSKTTRFGLGLQIEKHGEAEAGFAIKEIVRSNQPT